MVSSFPRVSANLPTDVITDIFTRLPVKSLSRFKCVSKSMYALLHNPVFIKNHLNIAMMQADPNLILKNEFKLFIVDDDQWSKARKLQVPFTLSLERVEISGSCNGLLCISDQRCNEDIFLFNPSTKIYKKLPVPEFDIPTIETTCFTSLGFGYHQADDDYKVIRCIYLYDKPFIDIDSYTCEARVYSLNTDTWKKIGAIPLHISSRAAVLFRNQFLVWKASRGLGRGMSVLVIAFDMDKEEFKEIPRPEVKDSGKCHIEVGEFNGDFSIFHMWNGERVEIWTVKELFGVKECPWKKLFVITRAAILDEFFGNLKPVCATKKNGKILIEKGEGELVLYDPENEIAKDFKIKGAPRWFFVNTCFESLVSPFTSSDEIA